MTGRGRHRAQRRPNARRLATGVVTTLAAVLALGAGAGLLTGHSVLVVTSGSMAPTIATGDAIVVRSVSPGTVRVGQVVTFRDPGRDQQLVTHRVTASRPAGDSMSFTTKGDANTGTEDWTVAADGRVGSYLFRLPRTGYVLAGLARPEVRLALLGAAAAIVTGAALRRIWAG